MLKPPVRASVTNHRPQLASMNSGTLTHAKSARKKHAPNSRPPSKQRGMLNASSTGPSVSPAIRTCPTSSSSRIRRRGWSGAVGMMNRCQIAPLPGRYRSEKPKRNSGMTYAVNWHNSDNNVPTVETSSTGKSSTSWSSNRESRPGRKYSSRHP